MLKKTYLLWLFGLASLSPNLPAQTDCSNVTQILSSECKALIALYNSTNGSQWKKNKGWLVTNTPCSWYGIHCNNGHVTRLYLQYNQLRGFLPPEIQGLSYLNVLNLESNALCGDIPVEFMKLVYLDSNPKNDLDLDNNHLTSSDPKLHKWLDERTLAWDNSQTPCPIAQNTVDNDKVAAPSGRPGPFYRIAYNAANRLAQNAWNNLGQDCTNTSVFVQIVGNGVDDAVNDIGTKYKGRSAEQFGNGFIDGLVDVLDEVVDRCVNECQMLGKASGEWSAKMFCRVATVVNHAPTFTVKLVNIRGTICGGAYRLGCESNFVGTISNMCPNYLQEPSTRSFYRAAENGCCSYNPY